MSSCSGSVWIRLGAPRWIRLGAPDWICLSAPRWIRLGALGVAQVPRPLTPIATARLHASSMAPDATCELARRRAEIGWPAGLWAPTPISDPELLSRQASQAHQPGNGSGAGSPQDSHISPHTW